jgi:hypothetical protein
MAFVHRANPGDWGVARSARIPATIEIETASKSQFSLVVQNVSVNPTSNVGTAVHQTKNIGGRLPQLAALSDSIGLYAHRTEVS